MIYVTRLRQGYGGQARKFSGMNSPSAGEFIRWQALRNSSLKGINYVI